MADRPVLALNPRGEGWHRFREFTQLSSNLGDPVCERVKTNEPCHGGIDMVNFAFFMAGHPMNFNITLFGGIPNGAPEILVGVRNTALAQTEATKPFKDSHGVTNVRAEAPRGEPSGDRFKPP